ncbi:hypothetical protein LTR62_004962 [Meristemomyces frigidus]|uniref:TAFII55 protein conserved region domain-containing protein n=1 Tax=Meristemomyces frigidus TaxID=1508187 RepID=A0AAN7YJB5_9PEZI|nr:hypothetical protein LTR62_004962 [Meristemomyces frigidus]
MPLLKLKTTSSGHSRPESSTPQSAGPIAASPAPSTTSTTGLPKLKLKASQPPTPATEQSSSTFGADAKKIAAPRKAGPSGKKRTANDDISPAAKRVASESQPTRRISLKVNPSLLKSHNVSTTPLSAGSTHKVKLGGPRKPSIPKTVKITNNKAARKLPARDKGVGYDSEDSGREEDPAIQQGIILRMQPGEDADLLRDAIANNRVGAKKEEGGVDVSIKFVSNSDEHRRACVKVRGRMYAAALVDLPCIIESMKSWDKKGWWKVADICQMLLVLGPVHSEQDIGKYPLPREVNKETMQYAHGLTPPMHHVRRRRFRKRVSHRQLENVEDKVEAMLKEDEEIERAGGTVTYTEYSAAEWERYQNRRPEDMYDDGEEMDAEGEAVETTEYDTDAYAEASQMEDDDDLANDLEAELLGAFANDNDAQVHIQPTLADSSELFTDSPFPINEAETPFAAEPDSSLADFGAETPTAQTPIAPTPIMETPVETPAATSDSDTHHNSDSADDSEEDDDSASSSEHEIDEAAVARAAQRAEQLNEIADLEREIQAVKTKAMGLTNGMLRRRELERVARLEGDLGLKRGVVGVEAGEDEGEGERQ